MINGRNLPAGIDLPPPPDDEFTFAEFIEAICRVTFMGEEELESKNQEQIVEVSLSIDTFTAIIIISSCTIMATIHS